MHVFTTNDAATAQAVQLLHEINTLHSLAYRMALQGDVTVADACDTVVQRHLAACQRLERPLHIPLSVLCPETGRELSWYMPCEWRYVVDDGCLIG